MALNQSVIWTDNSGNTTITLIRTLAGGGSIRNQVVANSNVDYVNEWEGTLHLNPSPAPGSGNYPSVQQQAILNYLCADNTIAQLRIPAPLSTLFMADGTTVDPSMIGAINTAVIGHMVSSSLSLATSYLSGTLQRRNR